MDGESSYDSDISESWSLIDVNVGEESFPVTETPSELENASLTDLENSTSTKPDQLEIEDFVDKPKEVPKTEFGPVEGSDSNSSFANEDFVSCSHKEPDGSQPPCNRGGDDDEPNDSDDVESIEILDMEGNDRDSELSRLEAASDSHDSQTYQSDDEELLDESISSKSRNNSSTVINRKRKKFAKESQSPVNSVFSDDGSPGKFYSKTSFTDASTKNGGSDKESGKRNPHPPFEHYKFNVTPIILSLSLALVFAGVATVAIISFLDVPDVGETAGELAETLKKLQVENAALHSRLSLLNRVLVHREPHPKSGVPPSGAPCQKPQQTSKTPGSDLNGAALSEIRSSLSSVEWLSKLQNLVRNDNRAIENGLDLNSFGKYIHDQLNYLRSKKEGGVKVLEEADRKISKVLQKIVTRLSTSQENIENLFQRLINLKDKLNKKLNKILPDGPWEIEAEQPKFEKRVPVTELDLQSIKWNSERKVAENSLPENPNSVSVYLFPQPEKYYQTEIRNSENERMLLKTTNSTSKQQFDQLETVKDDSHEEMKKEEKSCKCESDKSKHKKRSKEKSKGKEATVEIKEKRRKRTVNKTVEKQPEKEKKKKRRVFGAEPPAKGDFGTNFNELMTSHKTKHSKAEAEDVKLKPKFKKIKKPKLNKSFLSKLRKNAYGKRKPDHVCSMHECFNSTGLWVFKWANGREQFRRHQALGEWQFERAKGREELRDEDYGVNWQFRRALGRESDRHSGRCRWHHGKRLKFNGKEFFHDRFS